jgi:hypothetical protein
LVAGSDLEQAEIPIEGDLLFVGYGISSPENNWDDYEGLDVRGKILVMLVNDPPPTPAEPELFDREGADLLQVAGPINSKRRHGAARLAPF